MVYWSLSRDPRFPAGKKDNLAAEAMKMPIYPSMAYGQGKPPQKKAGNTQPATSTLKHPAKAESQVAPRGRSLGEGGRVKAAKEGARGGRLYTKVTRVDNLDQLHNNRRVSFAPLNNGDDDNGGQWSSRHERGSPNRGPVGGADHNPLNKPQLGGQPNREDVPLRGEADHNPPRKSHWGGGRLPGAHRMPQNPGWGIPQARVKGVFLGDNQNTQPEGDNVLMRDRSRPRPKDFVTSKVTSQEDYGGRPRFGGFAPKPRMHTGAAAGIQRSRTPPLQGGRTPPGGFSTFALG